MRYFIADKLENLARIVRGAPAGGKPPLDEDKFFQAIRTRMEENAETLRIVLPKVRRPTELMAFAEERGAAFGPVAR